MSVTTKESQGKTLIETLIENGYPECDIDHHDCDLYIYDNELTRKSLREWAKNNGWKDDFVSGLLNGDIPFLLRRFIDQITGKPMWDVAFQYYNYKENLNGV